MLRAVLTAIFIFCFSILHAQPLFHFKVIASDKDTAALHKLINYRNSLSDSVSSKKELASVFNQLYEKGFLVTSLDSMQIDSVHFTAFIKLNKQVEWAFLSKGNVSEDLLNRINLKINSFTEKNFYYKEIISIEEKLLTYCENNGFPFAKVWLDSIVWKENLLSASLMIDKGKLITIDSIKVDGDVKIANAYLYGYLGIKPGDLYNESLIREINKQVDEIPFVQQESAARIIFNDDIASIILQLKNRNASKFDLIIGVLPNNRVSGKVIVTGQGSLDMWNVLGRGERLNLSLDKLQPRSTEFKSALQYPYLLQQPFGINLGFEINKNDTFYIDVKKEIGLQYLFSGRNYIKGFVRNTSSSLLSVDTFEIKQSHILPSQIDLSVTYYGLEAAYEKLDFRLSPRKGWYLFASAAVGNRKVIRNPAITQLTDLNEPDFNFSSLYDSLPKKSLRYELLAKADKYNSISRTQILKLSFQTKSLIAPDIFQNELYRIGGNRLLRGFDEQSVYASWYNVVTAEYRYLVQRTSYLFLFADLAYIEHQLPNNFYTDWPKGVGAGLTFQTKAGIFGVSYAVGSERGNPLQLRSAKIHFGYINEF